MLTAAEVGRLLGIAPRTVYAIPDHALPRYFFGAKGGAVRFAEADVSAYQKTLPRPKGLLSCREARTMLKFIRAAEQIGVADSLHMTPEQMQLAEARYRRQVLAPWADRAAVRAIYAEAKRMTVSTGEPHHVDHVIPLLGEFVSGLHVETNMRVVAGRENAAKSNKFKDGEC